ncbi:Smr/MutS family protein [Algirhabdus cladophorae]|uniref:Smr/MutS family protein n=1 Tax=Algirhabdus cladophorae TaxID=3377108 RepID=UPI003B84945F
MARKKRRTLTSEEQDLWNKVVGRAEPLERQNLTQVFQPETIPAPHSRSIQPFSIGTKAKPEKGGLDLKPTLIKQLAAQTIQMDKKSFGNLKRGKLKPEGRIDLHGMTLSQAHPALVDFILLAFADQKRLVLVITGKGKDKPSLDLMPVQRGILRHQVPQWLNMAPLRSCILQVTQAHIRHGGEGAYYVYLKRRK